MLKKVNAVLTSVPATAVGGVFLVVSFVLSKLDVAFPVDPAWVTVMISGLPLLYLAAVRLVKNKGISKISSALLISIAMVSAIATGDLFAAGEVAFIMAIGEILEDLTTDRAKKGLKKLISLAPTQGRLVVDGAEKTIPAEDIRPNDILRVLPGETIPVDGVVISGETSVDQSVMTGESLPIDKAVGDEVFCGTVNRFGAVDIRATKVGESSSLQKLIRMVREAEDKKAPMARIADKAASYLVPVALLTAIIAGFATKDITRAVTVLVVFCPCALVLATPTAIMAAIGQATKHGVVIKSGEALERMGKVSTVAFDKTGTLTQGKLEVCDIISVDSAYSPDALLSLVATAETKSEHPLGKAIVKCAKDKSVSISEPEAFAMEAGKGVTTQTEGKTLICGNEKFLRKHGAVLSADIEEKHKALQLQGKATVLAACDGRCIGIIALSDVLRAEAADTVARLAQLQTDTVLLTGDDKNAAAYFAEKVGITQIHASLLPDQKVESIEALQANGQTVCMVGDGINDAPALKTADVGVAMGDMGSDIAAEAADIALMSDDISRLPYLKRLSVATVRTIKLSITLSMCINLAAVTLSVLGLLTPTTGALVHNAGSCFVVLIAALLYDRKF